MFVKEFETIYFEYYDMVFRYVFSLCKEETWAEEITQEAFFKALKNINSFRGECKLSVWLCQIAKNIFYKEAKKRKRQVDYPLEIIQDANDIKQKIYNKDEMLEIHKLLHKLKEPYKEVFWMRKFGELSFKDIGVIFGKSESWARVTYHRAKMKIKEEIPCDIHVN